MMRGEMNGSALNPTAERMQAWRRYWRLARSQRFVMAALTLGTLAVTLSVVLPVGEIVASPRSFFMATVWTTGLVQAAAVAGLASALRLSPLWGVCAVLPYAGLVVTLFLSARATKRLRAAGFRVGLLGARVPERMPPDWAAPSL
jgi:hypothetical protein